jgi:hypothetical protein
LTVGILGKTDTTRLSDAFEPRRYVDTVAHEVSIALLDHVTYRRETQCGAAVEAQRYVSREAVDSLDT